MAVEERHQSDVEAIIARRHDQGWDYWTTPDRRLIKGAPFHTLECAEYLLELGVEPEDPLLRETAELIFSTWRPDGRFKLYPKGTIFPCQTIAAARALGLLGHGGDRRIQGTLGHLLETQSPDGGWRCEKFFFGRGPETQHSNPNPTLLALDAFRLGGGFGGEPALDRAVEFLLWHWTVKKPVGPCHYGIGTLFMQVEYPFRGYNLFTYVHTLSFYRRAREDARFLEAFQALRDKLVDGQVVVERVAPKLRGLGFCSKGQPSALATGRYREILDNLAWTGSVDTIR